MLNALTVDVEDYYQVSGFERHVPHSQWDRYESRVVQNTAAPIATLRRATSSGHLLHSRLGRERFPELVREIHAAGHEIGSHSYWHRLVYELSPEEFREDLLRSRDVLEQVTGERQ